MISGIRAPLAALALVASLAVALPADAASDCWSNGNLAQVNLRLDGAIDQLDGDRRIYGGHKAEAIRDLQNARNELAAAKAWAISNDHENPACFAARNEGPRQGSLRRVRRSLETMIDQLQRDQHDYDGHRVRAIADMQAARSQLDAALAFTKRR